MKTTTQIKRAFIALLVILCTGVTGKLKAQFPTCLSTGGYDIINNTGTYNITVAWEIFDANCNMLIYSGGPVSIPPTGVNFINIPLMSIPTGATDIYVIVGDLNGDLCVPNAPVNGLNQSCNGYYNPAQSGTTFINGYAYSITWGCNFTTIN